MDIAAIVGIAALVIAWLTYKKTFPKITKEEVEREEVERAFLAQFRMTQQLANDVRDTVLDYATSNNLMDEDIFPGITYRHYHQTLEESHKQCLSSELYEKLAAEKYSRSELQVLIDSLVPQTKALTEVKSQLMLMKTARLDRPLIP